MGSDTYSPYREMDVPVGSMLPPPHVIDQRELDRLAAPRPIAGRAGQVGWRPSLVQGGHSTGSREPEMGSLESGLSRSGGRRLIDTRAAVRIGLAAVLIAGLLVVFFMPRAGADRGPVPAVPHVVQPGDTLWSIAGAYTPDTGDVRATVGLIRSANEGLSGLLIVGEVIEVPVGDIPGAPSGPSE